MRSCRISWSPLLMYRDCGFWGDSSWLAGFTSPFESSDSRAARNRRRSSTGSLLASSIICSSVAMNHLYSYVKRDNRGDQFTISVQCIPILPQKVEGYFQLHG